MDPTVLTGWAPAIASRAAAGRADGFDSVTSQPLFNSQTAPANFSDPNGVWSPNGAGSATAAVASTAGTQTQAQATLSDQTVAVGGRRRLQLRR